MTNEINAFRYSYSAESHKEIQTIRQKYLPREESNLEKLRRLDRQVQSAGVMPALIVGVLGALVFGVALCMGLDVLAGGRIGAILLSIPGVAAMLAAYPIFAKISAGMRKTLTPEILRLADEIDARKTVNFEK